MKRAVLVLLILSLCLGLCACGEPQVIEKEVEVEKIVEVVPEKYQGLIDALEAEDYDGAQAALDALKPVPKTPPIKEVKITTENFFDYFEYKEFPEENLWPEKDSAGILVSVSAFSGYYLKEEYTIAEERFEECKVEAGVKYAVQDYYYAKLIEADLDTLTYAVKGRPSWTHNEDMLIEGRYSHPNNNAPYYALLFQWAACLTNDYKNHTSTLIPEDKVELVSASGTLYLYE